MNAYPLANLIGQRSTGNPLCVCRVRIAIHFAPTGLASRERERPEQESKAGGQGAISIWRQSDPPRLPFPFGCLWQRHGLQPSKDMGNRSNFRGRRVGGGWNGRRA